MQWHVADGGGAGAGGKKGEGGIGRGERRREGGGGRGGKQQCLVSSCTAHSHCCVAAPSCTICILCCGPRPAPHVPACRPACLMQHLRHTATLLRRTCVHVTTTRTAAVCPASALPLSPPPPNRAVVASEKGVVVGRLNFREDGDYIDCTRMGVGGKAIPPNIDKVLGRCVCVRAARERILRKELLRLPLAARTSAPPVRYTALCRSALPARHAALRPLASRPPATMHHHAPRTTQVSDIRSDAAFVLLVEKDAAFMRLAEDRFYNTYPCIILTAKGQPDVATRCADVCPPAPSPSALSCACAAVRSPRLPPPPLQRCAAGMQPPSPVLCRRQRLEKVPRKPVVVARARLVWGDGWWVVSLSRLQAAGRVATERGCAAPAAGRCWLPSCSMHDSCSPIPHPINTSPVAPLSIRAAPRAAPRTTAPHTAPAPPSPPTPPQHTHHQAVPEEAQDHAADPRAGAGGLGPLRPQDPVSLHEGGGAHSAQHSKHSTAEHPAAQHSAAAGGRPHVGCQHSTPVTTPPCSPLTSPSPAAPQPPAPSPTPTVSP